MRQRFGMAWLRGRCAVGEVRVRELGQLALALLLLAAVCGVVAFASRESAEAAQRVVGVQAGAVEVPERRTRSSVTYRNSDGSFTTSVYAGPVNYRDGQGRWRAIESELEPDAVAGYAWRNRANSFRVRFKQELADDFVRFEVGGERFALSMLDASASQSVRSGRRFVYPDVLPGVNLRYELLPDGLKETLVLANADVPVEYRFLLVPLGRDLDR